MNLKIRTGHLLTNLSRLTTFLSQAPTSNVVKIIFTIIFFSEFHTVKQMLLASLLSGIKYVDLI